MYFKLQWRPRGSEMTFPVNVPEAYLGVVPLGNELHKDLQAFAARWKAARRKVGGRNTILVR